MRYLMPLVKSFLGTWADQFLHLRPDVLGRHERLADQDGPDARLDDLLHVVPREDPALADDQLVARNALGQPEGHIEGCHKRRQVAVVDPDDPGFAKPFEHQVQLPLLVHLEQDVQADLLPGQMVEINQLHTIESSNDQEHSVRQVCPRLVELQLVHHELLVERGQRHLLADCAQVVETALEELPVGQDGERGGAMLVIGLGDLEGVEVLAEDSPAGRGLFDFGNQARRFCLRNSGRTGRSGERLVEADRCRRIPYLRLQIGKIAGIFLLFDLPPLVLKYFVENHSLNALIVTLNEVKGLTGATEILRFAQNDSPLGRYLFVHLIRRSSLSIAAPDWTIVRASATPSCKVAAFPHATSACAALTSTSCWRAPSRPERMSRVICAFSSASPPSKSLARTRCSPKSRGSTM